MDSITLICVFGLVATGIIMGYPIGALMERRSINSQIIDAPEDDLYGILKAETLEEIR